jgi:MFS family permease
VGSLRTFSLPPWPPPRSPPGFAAYHARFGATLVNRLGGVVEPFLALYLAHRDLPVAQIGLIVALSGLGSLLGQLAGGVIADRIGRRQAFAIGMTGAAASFALLGAADATWLLVVGGFLAGGFTDLYRPASSALVHDLVSAADRPRAYGLLFWAINLGFAAGATLAGALAERGFGLLFALDGATCLACAAIIWRFVPPGTEPPRAADEPGRLRDVLADRLMVVFCLVVALQATVYMQSFSTLPLAMSEDGLGPSDYGVAIALNGVLIVVLQPLALPRLGRLRRRDALAGGGALIALGMGIEGLTPTLVAYALPVVIWTAGILVTSVAPATVADLAPAHLRARYQAVLGTAFSGAFIVAPAAGAALLDAAGGRALWGACGAVGIAGALGQLALGPAIARRTDGQ